MNTRTVCALASALVAGCASPDRVYTGYQEPDSSAVLGDLPSSKGVRLFVNEVPVTFEKIDGLAIALGPGSSPVPMRSIKVSPGPHRLGVTVAFPPEEYRASVDLNLAANRVVRLTGKVESYGYWVQIWDETNGFEKRVLLRQVELASVAPDQPGILQLNPAHAR